MTTSNQLTALQDKALETAHRFVDYESYEQKESKAVYALKKKCPGWPQEDYYTWLRRAIALHRETILFIDLHQKEAWAKYEARTDRIEFDGFADEFVEAHCQFDPDLVQDTLVWVFYLYHLR